MEQPLDPLVEAAVAPLSHNAEHRLAAISILSETADPKHPGALEAIARWESADTKWHPFLWQGILCISALIAVISLVFFRIPELQLSWKYRGMAGFEFPDPYLPDGLTFSGKLLVGDPSKPMFEQKEALYRSDVENPAFFAEYAESHLEEFGKLPDGYMETVSRIAPRNSYFLYLAATDIDSGVIGEKTSTSQEPEQRKGDGSLLHQPKDKYELVIQDQAAFDSSLALLLRARELPEFDIYRDAMLISRLRAMPRGGTFAERANRMILIYNGVRGIASLTKLNTLLCAQAQQLSRAGDADGFLAIAEARAHLIRCLAEREEGTLMDQIILLGMIQMSAEYFHFAAKRLGLDGIAEIYLAEFVRLEEANSRRRALAEAADHSWIAARGSPLSDEILGLVTGITESPPPLSIADLAPSRYADHALLMRIGLAAIALSFLVCSLAVFLFRFAFPSALRRTSARLLQLLGPSDWIITIALGAVFPLSFVLALQNLTVLGGREWGSDHFRNLFPGVHLIAILFISLLAPAVLIRWRLSRRIAPLGIPCRPGVFSSLALLGMVGLSIGAYPFAMRFGMEGTALHALAAAPAFWLATVLWNALRAIIGKAAERISLAATSMALFPSYAVAVILISLLLPVFKASEAHWLSKDTIHNLDPDLPDFGSYEIRIAAQKRKETRTILGLED